MAQNIFFSQNQKPSGQAANVMLKDTTPDDVTTIIESINAVTTVLKELRANMVDPGPREIKFSVIKAKGYIKHLKKWADGCKRKHEESQDEVEVAKERTKVESQPRPKRKN